MEEWRRAIKETTTVRLEFKEVRHMTPSIKSKTLEMRARATEQWVERELRTTMDLNE